MKKLANYLKKNRQALVNTIGVYFVLSYSVYNYKVKLAWEDFQKDFDRLRDEHEGLKVSLASDKVIATLESAVQNKKELKTEIMRIIEENAARFHCDNDIVVSVTKDEANDASALAAIGTSVSDIGQSKSTGKII